MNLKIIISCSIEKGQYNLMNSKDYGCFLCGLHSSEMVDGLAQKIVVPRVVSDYDPPVKTSNTRLGRNWCILC